MKQMSLDLETRSSADLKKTGVYRYAEDPDFDILLFGVSVDHGPVQVYDLACGDTLPQEILAGLVDESVVKFAYNAQFERICISEWLRRKYPQYFRSYQGLNYQGHNYQDKSHQGQNCPGLNYHDQNCQDLNYLNPVSWRCTRILGAYNGLPLSLEKIGAVLGFEEQKLKEGKDLIRYFCTPCKPTKSNGGRTWNLPEHAPEKWERFKQYNARDVEVEMQIQDRLRNYPVPDDVWAQYHLDQEINDRGIMVDRQLVTQAIRMDALSRNDLTAALQKKTGLENPNSVVQMKQYLSDSGLETDSLGKKEVKAMIQTAPENLADVLSLRLQLAKSSVRKYTAMENSVCQDDRCHGMFSFYGANRTGRWSGALVQLQNLPQNHMPDLDQARSLVRTGDYEMLSMLYESVPDVLSELIRTAFIPRPGYKFIVSDFSAIEARVLSYLAGEQWRIDVFHNGRDIYCESASRMFNCVVEKHGQNAHLRQKGKIAELALGYGGSVGALKAMGALDMGLSEDELQPLVSMWRSSNPNIVQFWWAVDAAVKKAITDEVTTAVGNIQFMKKSGMLFIILPSGRKLAYVKPRIGENKFGGESITYMGIDAQKKWSRIESYGPKITENLVQAISRDILAYAMRTLSGCRIVGHIHDELIIECSPDISLETICEQMGRSPAWLPGIELRADGYECQFYQKQ